MVIMKRILLTTALIGGFSLLGQAAHATPYSFTSSGSFSSLTGGATALSPGEFEWGGTFNSGGHYKNDGSTMTANPLSTPQTGNTPALGDVIGSLAWHNASTSSDSTGATVTADYKLTLNFSQPNPGGTNSETFDLTITNTANTARVCIFVFICSNTGDVDDSGSISSQTASFLVDGLLISNFTFSESGDGNYSNGVWTNPEDGDSILTIKANITNAPSSVPEPVSIALLGAGLLGLGSVRQRGRTV
jgi:hypothetical protein